MAYWKDKGTMKYEIPPRVEYRLTAKGQELVESVLLVYCNDEEMG